MNEYKAEFIDLHSLKDAHQEITTIGSDPKSIDIMAPKAVHKNIRLHNIIGQDAIIIKQDMLSIGGDVAIPKNAFHLDQSPVTILLIGSLAQLHLLVKKLNRHYPRIQHIAQEIKDLLIQVK